jgi:magnesium chelatase subunit I
VRLPLDLCLVFSANPEDYTNRGSIITPLRDRISSQILTHYPRTMDDALAITAQEAWTERGSPVKVHVPDWLREVVEEVAIQARASELVDQASGVSARVSISLVENVVSNAERRALLHGDERAVARASDVLAAASAVTGKIELVYEGEREGPQAVARALIGKAIKAVFDRRFPDAYAADEAPGTAELKPVTDWFSKGGVLELSDEMSDEALARKLAEIPELEALARKYLGAKTTGELAAGMELVLEGLHQASLLAKDEVVGGRTFRDMFEDMVKGLKRPDDKRKPPRAKG